MTSRERLATTLRHHPPDRVCVDFGSTAVTGMAVSIVSKLRRKILGDPEYRVKVVEPYQMLGEIDDELREALGIDVMGVSAPKNMFGFANRGWKPFTLFDGTEVLVPEDFRVTMDEKRNLLIYPEGDTSVPPSGRMPEGGYFFDAIPRQEPIVEETLDPAANLEEFSLLTDADLRHYAAEADRALLREKGSIVGVPGTAFGDIALVPALGRKHTRGIREIEEWYVSTSARREYVYKVFEGQCAIALQNLEKLIAALGDNVQAGFVTGTDFGTQTGLFISRKAYRELYMPFHKIVNEYIHQHSSWKSFIHSCGCVVDLIPDFIEAGFDILNPVQTSAAGMDPLWLKKTYGKDLVFWGGGVDTQKTLPYGSPAEVYDEVRERVRIFNDGGGFVFNTVHNIQANVPVENVEAMFRALAEA
ncbi:MAG: methyltransferase [Bacteroidetes bacterium]|nr:methyltransferase [Bacteroidota bacterium]